MAVKKKNSKTKKASTAKKSAGSRGKNSSRSKDYLDVAEKKSQKTSSKAKTTKDGSKRTQKSGESSGSRRTEKNDTRKVVNNREIRSNTIHGEIIAIITLVLGVFFAVAMHTSLTGVLGDFIGKFFRGMFGITGYFIPYIMIVSSVMVFLKREKPFTRKHAICIAIIFFMVNLINSERFLTNFSLSSAKPAVVYSMGNQLMGGGILGMYPGKIIETAIGPVGIYLFSIATILIATLIVSDVTLTGIFKAAKNKNEIAKNKREERRMLQLERQADMEQYENYEDQFDGQQQNFFNSIESGRDIMSRSDNSNKNAIRQSVNHIKNRPSDGVDYISMSDAEKRLNMKDKLETNRRKNNILSLVKNEIFHTNQAEKSEPEKNQNVFNDKSPDDAIESATVDMETGEITNDTENFSDLRNDNQELQINIAGMNMNDFSPEIFDTFNDADILPENENYGLSKTENNEKLNTVDFVGNNLTDSKDLASEKNALNNLENQQKSHRKTESKEERKEREKTQVEIQSDIENKKDQAGRYETEYKLPDLDLLNMPEYKEKSDKDLEDLRNNAATLEKTLKSFNVDAKVINVTKGSSVTRYEVQPAVGTKVSSIVRLSDDIALNLRAKSIRMEAPIPGKAAVGIEIENESREMVTIGEMIGSEEFKHNNSKLSFVVGKDIAGNTVVADLAKMPHMLIAGATGSGKSVCINTIIASILYNANPNEVKLLLIDPKMVELGNYNGIPHLLIPVVTDSNKAAAALNWAVSEMTSRYKKFAENSVREIKGYNKLMKKNGTPEEVMPQIVIIIDELADLMMVASSLVEEAICRLAQLARAAGIHLIVATQRPSVDVVTGLIKANIPSRIAFMVSSQVDSRTIIDMTGAEKLVGNGDMLFKPQNLDKPIRVQGPFISDEEVERIIEYIKAQNLDVDYDQEVIKEIKNKDKDEKNVADSDDVLMEEAIKTVIKAKQASVSMLQRRFRIGYNRAARMVDDMEMAGIVGPQDGSRPRTVLVDESYFNRGNIQEEESQVNGDNEDNIEKIGLED